MDLWKKAEIESCLRFIVSLGLRGSLVAAAAEKGVLYLVVDLDLENKFKLQK